MVRTDAVFVSPAGDPAEVASVYARNGVAVVPDFIGTQLLAELRAEAKRLEDNYSRGELERKIVAYRPMVEGGEIFERIDPVCHLSPLFGDLSQDVRLLAIVSHLLNDPAPVLMKDKIIYKLPTDKGYLLHQDYPYLIESRDHFDNLLNAAINLDAITPENGGLKFYLNCHNRLQPAPPTEPRDVAPEALHGAATWDGCVAAGALILLHGLAPHESGPNRTPYPRRLLYYTYVTQALRKRGAAYYRQRQKPFTDAP